jgi:hypothetical protein
LLNLELLLNESLNAENFFETGSGKLIVELLTKEITILVKRLTSDEFKKDHMGYVNTLSDLQARQGLLKKLQVAASPVRRQKIREKLDERENS